VKTSLDAEDSTESHERDKNVLLHLKFLRRIHIYAFAILIFGNFRRKSKNLFSASRLVFSIVFCASPTSEEHKSRVFSKKVRL